MKHRLLTALVTLLACMTASTARGDGPVFDVKALLAPPLETQVLKTTEHDGIVTEEIKFLSHVDGTERIEIFAFFSYPKGAKALPAFVWNQGGLYPATTYFTELGARRGYAALCIDFPIPGAGYRSTGKYPINSGLELPDDPRKAPIYYGCVALLRAVSFLESRPEVDKERIGMSGSSWGGFYTTLMTGIDTRIKAGSAMFGSGHMEMGNGWWGARAVNTADRDDDFLRLWKEALDPATRLTKRKVPIAWFTGTNDQFYWLPAVCATRDGALGPTHLVLLPNWNHGLTPNLDDQVFRWLDIQLKGDKPFLDVSKIQVVGGSGGGKDHGVTAATFTWTGDRKPSEAWFAISPGAWGAWSHRIWITVPAKIEGGVASATLPPMPMGSYIYGTVIDADHNWSSTSITRLDSITPDAPVTADGCAEWGSFEPAGITYLVGQGFMNPTVKPGAGRNGSQAIALVKGGNAVQPIHFVPGLKHRLTLWLRGDRTHADKPAAVTVELTGRFDNEPNTRATTARITDEWTKVELDYDVPARVLVGTLGLNITLHGDAALVLDDVSFTPVTPNR